MRFVTWFGTVRLKWRQGAIVFLKRAWSVRMLLLTALIGGAKDYWFAFSGVVRTDYFLYIGIGLTFLALMIEQPKMCEKIKEEKANEDATAAAKVPTDNLT